MAHKPEKGRIQQDVLPYHVRLAGLTSWQAAAGARLSIHGSYPDRRFDNADRSGHPITQLRNSVRGVFGGAPGEDVSRFNPVSLSIAIVFNSDHQLVAVSFGERQDVFH
jgi:hypothetical protein